MQVSKFNLKDMNSQTLFCLCTVPHDLSCPAKNARYYQTPTDDDCVNENICGECGRNIETEGHDEDCIEGIVDRKERNAEAAFESARGN